MLWPGQHGVSLFYGRVGGFGAVKAVLVAAFAAASGPALADGAAVFGANCALCHQDGGVGVPGQFPRLAGRVGQIAVKPEGKAYLRKVLLNGMSGRVMVDGEQIIGIMPSFDSLSDSDISQVLTYVSGLDHVPTSFTPEEIAATRSEPKIPPTELLLERAQLTVKKIVP